MELLIIENPMTRIPQERKLDSLLREIQRHSGAIDANWNPIALNSQVESILSNGIEVVLPNLSQRKVSLILQFSR